MYRPPLFYLITVKICCHNTDQIHVNGVDRTILVILAKGVQGSLIMDSLWSDTCWSTFKYFIILNISTYYIIVHKLDNKIFIYLMGICYIISDKPFQLAVKILFWTHAHFVSLCFGTFAKPVDTLPALWSRHFTSNVKEFSYFVQIFWKSPLMSILPLSPLNIKWRKKWKWDQLSWHFPF